MKYLLLLLLLFVTSCGGLFVVEKYSDNVPPRIDIEPFFSIHGSLPEGLSFEDFQVVAYQTTPVRKVVPYESNFFEKYKWKKRGIELDLDNPILSYSVYIDEKFPANEIVWYNKGVPYQTLSIEYTEKDMDIVSIRAFWNGEQELCLNSFYGGIARRIHIHMPDTRMPEEEWFTVFKDNPKCYETE
ncbi:hypothetical protein [Fibrobacter sp.]|jgi:hypothetical protein|uniref:hypothetical protein n=1 Tax=Fibrobacter sp. TaxID=35828 RepID=UPI0025BDD8BA|nr:hypothetical protein [Fibrobacter sp.]MBR3072766.1 hypothetical protein [Fibrobacter sp.]